MESLNYSMADFFLTIYRSPLPRIRYWILVLVITWFVLTLFFSWLCILRIPWSVMNSAACTVGLALILWITVLRRTPGKRTIYVLPFYAFYLAMRQPEMYREMLMNVFMFVPVGLTLPYAVEMAALLNVHHRKNGDNKQNATAFYKKGVSKTGAHWSRYADKEHRDESHRRITFFHKPEALDGSCFIGKLRIIGYAILVAAVFSFCIELLQGLFGLGTAEVDDVIMNTLGVIIGCCPFLVRFGGIKHSRENT